MTWIRLEDSFFRHRKVIELSKDAKLLFIAGLCYCGEQMTDGFISNAALRVVAAVVDVKATAAAKELVDCGLWHKQADGYDVHDYLQHQTSAAEIREKRQETADRVKRWREGRRNAPRNSVTPSVTNAEGNDVGNGDGNDVRTPSIRKQKTEVLLKSPSHLRGLGSETAPGGAEDGKTDAVKDRARTLWPKRLWQPLDDVLAECRRAVDDVLIDEAVGALSELKERPAHPNYLLTTVKQWAIQRGAFDHWPEGA